ncbi:TIGR00341 family protein [Saliphagus infecundisoli]|uniref:TIGR00341 family protein n=1 Tax=Saliphagus infecundisoli TaxID=1849069 RepID=A0ABD5QLL8_9EURY|nr:TIGR00341 family protein [Saliphagus infecundisoli]
MSRSDTRLITVLAESSRNVEAVVEVLNRYDLDYSVTDRDDGSSRTVIVPVPTRIVERIEEELATAPGNVTVVVSESMAVHPADDASLPATDDVERLGFERISRSELRSKAESQLPPVPIFGAMSAISAVVATAGVLLDSLAVLVGAMVIAPLLGPAMGVSVATVLDDRSLFARGVRLQLIGLTVGFASALAFAGLARTSTVVSSAVSLEASLRLGSHTLPPSLLVTVAVCGGVAGGLAMATSGMTDLIGVMIAAAIMPPIGVAGVGLAWYVPPVVTGSLVVVVLNILAINLGALGTLWALGYHPHDRARIVTARSTILRRVVLITLALVLAIRLLEYASGTLHP